MPLTHPATEPSTRPASRPTALPGPRSLNPLSSILAFWRHPLSWLTTMSQQYGDIWQFRFLNGTTIVLNHPNYLKYILQEKYLWYDKKVPFFSVTYPVVGNGLATNADAKHWLQQRRLIQPTFHKQRLEGFATTMVEMTLTSLRRWETQKREGQPFHVMEEMNWLVLNIVGRTLFSTDVSTQTSIVYYALTEISTLLTDYFHMPFPPPNVPTARSRRLKKALNSLHAVVDDLIHHYRESDEKRGDMLSILLHATDEQTGERMSDQQLHNEIMTFLLAGSDTTTSTLSWIWYVLGLYPEVEQSVHEEVDRVLEGRLPTVHDLAQLTSIRMVIDEVLRLYPPLPFSMRRVVQDDEIGGYHIPKETSVLWSPYLIHRHPDFWEEPEQFRPERFLPEQVAKRQHYSYLPFGGGPHICIGSNFALMEMVLIVALVASRYRLELMPGYIVEPKPFLTLRPSREIPAYLRPRR